MPKILFTQTPTVPRNIATALRSLMDLGSAQTSNLSDEDMAFSALELLEFMQVPANCELVAVALYEQRLVDVGVKLANRNGKPYWLSPSAANSLQKEVISSISDLLEYAFQRNSEFSLEYQKLQNLKRICAYTDLVPVSKILTHLSVSACFILGCIRPLIGYGTSDFVSPRSFKTNTLQCFALAFLLLPSLSALFLEEVRQFLRASAAISASTIALLYTQFLTPEEQALSYSDCWPYLALPAVSFLVGFLQFGKAFQPWAYIESFQNLGVVSDNFPVLVSFESAAWRERYAKAVKCCTVFFVMTASYWAALLGKSKGISYEMALILLTLSAAMQFSIDTQIVSSLVSFCFASMQLGSSAAQSQLSFLNVHQSLRFIEQNALLFLGLSGSIYNVVNTTFEKLSQSQFMNSLQERVRQISVFACLDHILGSIFMAFPSFLVLSGFLNTDDIALGGSSGFPVPVISSATFLLSVSLPLLPTTVSRVGYLGVCAGAFVFEAYGLMTSASLVFSMGMKTPKFIASIFALSLVAGINSKSSNAPETALTIFSFNDQPADSAQQATAEPK